MTSKTVFFSAHNAKLDDKARLIFPAQYRAACVDASPKFIVRKDVHLPCLNIYPVQEWIEILEQAKAKFNLSDPVHNRVWQQFNRNIDEICPDEKTGRISISKILLEKVGITKEVIFVGMGEGINLWDTEVYNNQEMPDADYADLLQSILS